MAAIANSISNTLHIRCLVNEITLLSVYLWVSGIADRRIFVKMRFAEFKLNGESKEKRSLFLYRSCRFLNVGAWTIRGALIFSIDHDRILPRQTQHREDNSQLSSRVRWFSTLNQEKIVRFKCSERHCGRDHGQASR